MSGKVFWNKMLQFIVYTVNNICFFVESINSGSSQMTIIIIIIIVVCVFLAVKMPVLLLVNG